MTSVVVPGLCSITLRALPPDEVLACAAASGLRAIEWGGDVHVPPGSPDAAAWARRCAEVGIATPSYGSYLMVAGVDLAPLPAVLDTAEALGASTVRVWTPFGVTPDAAATERGAVVDALGAVCAAASVRGLRVGLEFHPGTLTHDAASAVRLLDEVGAANLWTYWQPETGHADDDRCLAELGAVAGRLAHVHAFSWGPGGISDRRPLEARRAMWEQVFAVVAAEAPADGTWSGPRVAYLEYVEDDDADCVRRDAAVLAGMLARSAAA